VANINVVRKRNTSWVWWVIAIVVLAIILFAVFGTGSSARANTRIARVTVPTLAIALQT